MAQCRNSNLRVAAALIVVGACVSRAGAQTSQNGAQGATQGAAQTAVRPTGSLWSARSRGLTEDIKAHGLREKIWIYEGKILDGRNRFLACQKARVRPQFRKFTGKDPLAFIISLKR